MWGEVTAKGLGVQGPKASHSWGTEIDGELASS